MYESLDNKVVVISGGNSGIGYAVTKLCVHNKMKVAVLYHTNPLSKEQLVELNVKESMLKQYKIDARDIKNVQETFDSIYKEFERIDYLVNSSGVTSDALMAFMPKEEFDFVVDTNLKGCFNLMKTASMFMLASNESTAIVNISSIAGLMGVKGQTNYCASKFGIIGMTKALAKEIGHKGIRVNAIAPGYIETRMTEKLQKNSIVKNIPMRRFGRPEEIASVVLFLISKEASYINGETIVVDGGISS